MGRQRGLRQQAVAPPAPSPTLLQPARALALPLAFTLLLFALSLLPAVRRSPHLLWSFWGAGAILLAWNAGMLAAARGRGRTLAVEIALRKQHYLQACAHMSILLYWGWYWREVYNAAPLIAAQLAFAYAFDALLAWSRRDTYTLGFGPFPIIFSTNLFLWFKPDWFYLQFLMVGVGFAAKELIRWNKEGRQAHIFNPSSFTLMLFSVVLILTGKTGISWGPEIASTQLNPPHIYLWIFLVSLPGQFLFGVAPMTWAAVATAYTVGGMYFAATGIHFFPERPIPIAVFLGMHLLFTDPSTSPRTELGRLMFGVLYGLSVVGFLALLTFLKVPTFYDKLLPVPILNLLIQRIDKTTRSNPLKRFDPEALGRGLLPKWRNLAYMAIWALTFITMQVMTGTQATLVRANSLLNQGRIEEAIERYREFVATDPADSEGHNNLGVALMQAGQFEDAVRPFQRSIELRPNSPNTLKNLGLALMRTGRDADAVAPLQRAVALEPSSAETHKHLGQALMQTERVEEGVSSLRHAVELQPNSPEAHDDLGVALTQAGRFEDAIVTLRRAVELQPNNAETLNNLGVALMRTGRFADAVVPFQSAIQLQPSSLGLHDHLGQALMQAGRFADGVASFQRAVELQPNNPQTLNNLGVAFMQAGRLEDAVASLRHAVDVKPDYAQGRYNLAQALAALGQPRSAVSNLREALRVEPDSLPALASLAWLEATEPDAPRDPGDAVRLASRAADLSGERDAHILDVLAAAYAAAGRFGDASRMAEKAEALAAAGSDLDLAAQIRVHLSAYRGMSGRR